MSIRRVIQEVVSQATYCLFNLLSLSLNYSVQTIKKVGLTSIKLTSIRKTSGRCALPSEVLRLSSVYCKSSPFGFLSSLSPLRHSERFNFILQYLQIARTFCAGIG